MTSYYRRDRLCHRCSYQPHQDSGLEIRVGGFDVFGPTETPARHSRIDKSKERRETSRPPASYRPISLLSGLGKLFERSLKTHLSDHLLGKGLIIDEHFNFRPVLSCPQQVLRLVEYECAYSTRRLIRAGVPQGSSFSPLLYSAYTNDILRPSSGVQRVLFADNIALYYRNRNKKLTFLYLQRENDDLGR
ncbi:hypothetical protein EVAR_53122_1 [Eumeta japonica]|uniref:Reverse transcriptase domain-containing protein n=1 Tax=Eumeta variegata TaxID=151549 RepID=A0A4C1YAI4_EUMVA|nr:hypothetical protein EVAR_53122_1 [Eumeta japonica]